jgi:hypothetical protein
MKNVLIDPVPMGSRWELFIDLDDLENFIKNSIEENILSKKSKNYGAIINRIEDKIYVCLIFKNARLTQAFPFFYDTTCYSKVQIKKIQTTAYGDAYIVFDINGSELCATSVDYSFNKQSYSKKMKLYFTAIAYNLSKIDLKSRYARDFVKINSGFPEEYTITGEVMQNYKQIYVINPINSFIKNLPVLSKQIYMQKPSPGQIASGDLWLTCFSEDFSVSLESKLV